MNRGHFDLLVIGAGVNGAGLARDASGRGLKVALVDAADIGGATSSASTKLIHGGLRYLEFYEFRLVRKALAEREVLLDIAAHLTRPMPFILPLGPDTRPGWMIRAGLFLYDNLAHREQVPGSSKVVLRDDHAGQPLDKRFTKAFRYWDGWVDDARLVIANAQDAAARGALVLPRTAVTAASRTAAGWEATLGDGTSLSAAHVVNCAGPWAGEVAADVLGLPDAPRLRLVQGAHLITRRIGRGQDSYILQQPDGRIVFIIPYEADFSLIGTTETAIPSPDTPRITEGETDYLLAAANCYLSRPLERADIISTYAGIRPLVLEEGKGARETTRDWKLVAHEGGGAVTVVGGKITTYRLLAEDVLGRLFPESGRWTAEQPLPGSDFPRLPGFTGQQAWTKWREDLRLKHGDYDPQIVDRLARLYGTRADTMLERGLGENLGGVFTAELEHMVAEEWAQTADDALWRRSKLGLHLSDDAKAAVAEWFAARFTKS
ncbi:glycerol-3-phosphate dehydrogenase [Sphingosinicella microcystinivorans]|uniref:glycerol-3-phosphate dehydrogenase n=1 Tax=Sphingosinicella microcystinivorans TaxID=335406 RepID=UPI0022F3A23C|nr:glycerol-3-phosphate dehydrogenase [Sphingosinicella microcystinivorans]WBX83357.1 glycerol-3-phosphate dehydrogenase [Sphingosinicella microcystinivorans]